MKRWREEKGSALVMVMFMMLILTLLGVTILSATVAGSRRTLTRENDIQSLQLTQKVLDESVAYISTKLNEKVAEPNFDSTQLKSSIDSITGDLVNRSVKTEANVLHDASGALVGVKVINDFSGDTSPDSSIDDLKKNTAYTVELTAIGTVNGVQRTLTQDVKVNMYPDFLKYAFGSEQDLILNGAPYINGNIYAGNKLIATNHPEYKYKGVPLETTSLYPKIYKDPMDKSKDSLVYIQGLDDFLSGDRKDNLTSVTADGDAKVADRIDQALGIGLDQLQIKNRQKFVSINVEQSFMDKLAEAISYSGISSSLLMSQYKSPEGMSAVINTLNATSINKLKMPEPAKIIPLPVLENPDSATDEQIAQHNANVAKVIEQNQAETTRYNNELGTLANTLKELPATSIFQGDLVLEGEDLSTIGVSKGNKQNWLIVNGNLTFAGQDLSTSVLGNVLVTGNVRFQNTVYVDSTMLVMGNTTIEDATILGKDQKEIVLMSKGPVLLNRVDAFKNTVQKLSGFFYTDSSAKLYGVGSKFELQGGFFAKGNLEINAVIGDSTAGDTDISFAPQSVNDEGFENVSRFKVYYNDAVYAHQNLGLPQVEQISVSAGKIQIK